MTHLSDKATDKEVLEAAMEVAVEKGYKLPLNATHFATEHHTVQFFDENKEFLGTTHRNAIIFDHEFCKALWGNGKLVETKHGSYHEGAWGEHIAYLALAKDRIDYLRKHMSREV